MSVNSNNTLDILVGNIKKDLSHDILSICINFNYVNVVVKTRSIQKTLLYLRDHEDYKFIQLINLCGVDYLGKSKERFEVIYNLLSLEKNLRICVKIRVNNKDSVPTVVPLFSSAGWYERETWDLFGINFEGHPDLRRILTDYGFEGHPLRKDFPLSGYVEPRYDEEKKEIVYGPVKLPQAYRNFDFLSPWENFDRFVLPGDDKPNS